MPGFEYTTFKNVADPVAGLMRIAPEMVNTRPHWAIYYTVNDADEAAREAVQLDAKLHVPLQDIPGVGRYCGITSPQGVLFQVIQYSA